MAWQVEGADEFADWFLASATTNRWTLDASSKYLLSTAQRYRSPTRRTAILGNSRWYDENVPFADDRYNDYLREMEKEGLR